MCAMTKVAKALGVGHRYVKLTNVNNENSASVLYKVLFRYTDAYIRNNRTYKR